METLYKILRYIKIGCLLHVITIIELVVICILLTVFHLGIWILEKDTVLRFFILLPVLWAPIFPQLDARSRFQDYKMVKDCFYIYGFDVRLVKHFSKSRCQRDAVIVAAADMGYGERCVAYFKVSGYRWYHLLPDVIFEKPLVLLSWHFYKKIFFANTYHSKVGHLKEKTRQQLLQIPKAKAA